jgi:hypothetical protein
MVLRDLFQYIHELVSSTDQDSVGISGVLTVALLSNKQQIPSQHCVASLRSPCPSTVSHQRKYVIPDARSRT